MQEELEEEQLVNLADYYYHERLPAWTDRILYQKGSYSELNFIEYNSLNDVYLSDHK